MIAAPLPLAPPKRVVGLDLSLTGCAIAHPDGTTEVLDPRERRDELRLLWLVTRIHDATLQTTAAGIDMVAIEGLSFGSTGGKALERGALHWMVRCDLYGRAVPFVIVSPSTLKKYATGRGSGPGTEKRDMAVAAYKRAGAEFRSDDECDAAWLRWYALDGIGCPQFDMPKDNRAALRTVFKGVSA